jgi:hypothetical protein
MARGAASQKAGGIKMAGNSTVQGSGTSAVPANNASGVPAPHRYREAFERALPVAQALAASDLAPINIDLPTAIAATVGRLPGIMALRDEAAALARFEIAAFDQLETYTLATAYAHTLYMGASSRPEAIGELNERGMQLRKTLYLDAVALATRNLIHGDRIGELKANVGYKNLAFDLMALAAILRGNWHKISGRTAITADDLDQAELLGDQLVSAVGSRKEANASIAEASAQRQRNFSLLLNAYDQVRRAVIFLRWNDGDADHIAPSLYSGRGNSNARKRPEPPVTGHTPGTSPSTPADPQPSPIPTGLPGAEPFDWVS